MNNPNSVPHGPMAQVLGFIPRGATNPRTVSDISRATGIAVREVHRIIRTLVIKYNVPVGGVRADGRHGVFIITNEDERAAAVGPLMNNAQEIERRITKLQEITL